VVDKPKASKKDLVYFAGKLASSIAGGPATIIY